MRTDTNPTIVTFSIVSLKRTCVHSRSLLCSISTPPGPTQGSGGVNRLYSVIHAVKGGGWLL